MNDYDEFLIWKLIYLTTARRICEWLSGSAQLAGATRICFSPATPWTNGLSVAYGYGNILDGDKPTCLDSTWPMRTCRAAQFVLFIISLELCGGRGIADATSFSPV